jgi:predicted dehydrogenase
MPQNRETRIALVGCGNIGVKGHLPVYAGIPNVTLVGVCDTIEPLTDAAAELTGAPAYTNLGDLLEGVDVDAVDICTPPRTHAELAIQAMEAGKHVLCEKPIAHSLQDADAMIEAASANKVRMMIGQVRRFDHRYVALKNQIDAGRVGRPVFIRRAERQLLPFPSDTWFWDPAAGGGVILDIGVHALDLFRWMFDDEPVEIRAVARAVHRSAREAGSFDYAMITCKFARGGIGFAEASWAHPEGFGPGLYASLDVVGTDGILEYSDRNANPMLEFDNEKGATLPRYFALMSATEHAFEAQITHFVDSVREGQDFVVDAHDARTALSMALAAQQSAMSDQVVIPEITTGASDNDNEGADQASAPASPEGTRP